MKVNLACLLPSALCVALVSCGEPEGAVDRAALVLEFTARPSSVRPGQAAELAWSANESVLSVRVTAGDCPDRRVESSGIVAGPACAEEVMVASDLSRSGTLLVTPAGSTTYWCFPDRIQDAGFVFGRTARVEVVP